MTALKLWLCNPKDPELHMTEFSHPLLEEELLCVRGKAEGAYSGSGTFQWTSAVRAMTVFFLLAKCGGKDGEPLLEGKAGSMAASLDYALGKLPLWLTEMFGRDGKGASLAYRLINRTNPERKRPGPVSLSLNRSGLPLESITIALEDRAISEPQVLRGLAERIAAPWGGIKEGLAGAESSALTGPPVPELSPLVPPLEVSTLQAWLQKILWREARSMLNETALFHPKYLKQRLSDLERYERFRRLAGKGSQLLQSLLRPQPVSARLGVAESSTFVDRELQAEPLRVVASISQVGALCIFTYLKYFKRYKFEINLRFPHSVRLVDLMAKESSSGFADLCVLTLAPAAHLLGKNSRQFKPLLLMPPQSYRTLAGKEAADQKTYEGRFLLLTEEYSSAFFRLDALERKGLLNPKRIAIDHCDNDEIFSMLGEETDLRTILGFPFYELLTRFGRARLVGAPNDHTGFRETVLFAASKLFRRASRVQAVEIALRDAWLDLCEEGPLLSEVVKTLVEKTEYLKLTRRFGGLY